MDAIKDIIPRVIAPLSNGQTSQMDMVEAWKRLAGTNKGTSLAGFKDGCLTVNVDCAARLVKMNAQKADYLDDLKAKLPQVKDIRFKVGKVIT